MQTVGIFEAKTHFSALLDEVKKGKQVLITKHGRPIAKLMPVAKIDNTQKRQVIKEIIEFGRRHKLGGLNRKALHDE